MEVILGNFNPIGIIFKPVSRQVGYIFKYKSNIVSLETEVEGLRVARNGMQQKIDQATRNVEEILDPVLDWMERSRLISEVAVGILEGHAEAKCSFRSFPNLFCRHRLSKDAKKMADSIASLRTNISNGSISCSRVPPSSDEMIEGYAAFESRNSIMNQIMEALKDPEVRVVGLHGMGGSGKTMLAKEVSRRARLDKVFEIDVMVTVSQIQNLQNIQEHIAEKLGLNLTEKSVPVRADKLRKRLREEKKKILITLDDVWDKLDLQEIGVSFGNNQKGCKIFLTSRSAHVCDIMKAEKSTTFKLSDLTDKEARLLFDKNVGVGDSARRPDFKNLAAEITKECAGLPLAIVIVASALKNRELNAWQDALLQLQKSTPTNIDGMIKQVYSSIMISFKYLESEEARYLLLLCSLHAEDAVIGIEDLIKYSVGLRFSDIIRLKEVRNRVQNLVGKLKLCNLLLDGKDEMSVKMHDVVRDACLYIASRDECMHFIRDVAHLKEVESKKLEESTAISLPYEAFNQLPQKLKYPKLKLLLLRGNESQPKVEILNEECFEEMKDLRVLCLINIRVNPTCFSSLKNLQTLCLRHCKLQDIAPIGELNNLKILDLSNSSTFSLPREIGQLAQLQLLDLNYCTGLNIVVPHVLSNLKNLEELHMRDFGNWGEGNASPRELMDLVQLTNLDIDVPYFEILPRANDMISLYNNLERYHIIIGDWDHTDYLFLSYSKILQLQLAESHYVKAHGLESLIKTAQRLFLKGFVDVIDISELDNYGFPHVKSLTLERMLNLQKICSGKLKSSSFGNLKKVKVEYCNHLKSLFSFCIARQFEKITVLNCQVLQEIGTHENEYESHNAINDTMKESQLVTLVLDSLPKLNRFFLPPEAETISISEKGNELFNTKVLFPKLRNLSLFRIEVVKLWPDKIQDASFMENLRILTVYRCSNLNYLFSFDVAKSLKLLERLDVRELQALEVVIVVKEEMEVKGMEKTLFPKLLTLILYDLPNMATFCSQCSFEFPSLKTLRINECPKVSDLAMIRELNNLEVLDISGFSFVELPRGIERSTQLKSLDLSYCKPLKMIQPDVISKLIHLEELILIPKSYIARKAEGINSGGRNNASFMEFKNLPKLKVLELFVIDFSILPKDMFSEKWKVCHIKTKDSYISFNVKDSYGHHNSSELKLSLNKREIEIVSKCGFQVWLKISEELRLDGCEDVNDIIYELNKDGFPQLRELTLKNNKDAQYIVNSFSPSTHVFVGLETLSLENLTTLEGICHDEPKIGSFRALTSVNVINCVRLKSLFSISIAIQLRKLTVQKCEAMEAIVTIEGEDYSRDSNDLAFTEIWELKLINLPRLVQFCSKLKTTSTSHWREEQPEEELEISMPLFDAKVQMPQLSHLWLERIGSKQIWHHQHSPTFDNLTNLHVSRCHNLKSLMSYSIAANLGFLSYLRVSDCENMKEVISTKEEEGKLQIFAFKTISFNELRTLILKNLSSLGRFSSTSTIKAPQKKTLLDGEVQMPQLSHLCLERIGSKQIWHHQHSPTFDNLTYLHVSHCHNLKSLMSYSIAANLGFLSFLTVSDCENMEEVISTKEEEEKLQIFAFKTIAFNELRILTLKNLSSLRRFSSTSTIKAPQKKTLLDGEVIVPRCDGLESLTTPSFSFHNLNELEVSKCNGLINFFDSSMVKGLLHLESIIISECEGMTEIIGNDHESAADTEIVLKELRSLYLNNLPNLRCFYSGNSTISFPNLEKLVVRQCFEMQVFSHGIVNSPVLHSLITEVEDATTIGLALAKVKEQRWEGNINSTIEKISEERNKMTSSNLNEEVTNQKDSMEYNNEDELSSKFTELSGEEVMKDSRKGKLEQVTKSSCSGQ